MDRLKSWNKIRESIPGSFYLICKASNLEKDIRLSKPVLESQTHFTPFTELERHHRELEQLDELLEAEREYNKIKEIEFSKRWEIAYERHADLEYVLGKFAIHHEECQDKIEKDNSRTITYLNEIKEKDQELKNLKKQVETFKNMKEEIANRRDLCEIYKDYMNQVVHASGQEYLNIKELIARFEDLKKIRDDKVKRTLESVEKIVHDQEIYNQECLAYKDEEIAYKTHLSDMEQYKERMDDFNGGLNDKVILVKENAQKNILNVEQPKKALYGLYLNFCKEMKQPAKVKESDIKGQLAYIQQYLGEMRKISTRVRESLKGDSDLVICPESVRPTRNHPGGSGVVGISKSASSSLKNSVVSEKLVKKRVRPISERSGSSPYYNREG